MMMGPATFSAVGVSLCSLYAELNVSCRVPGSVKTPRADIDLVERSEVRREVRREVTTA